MGWKAFKDYFQIKHIVHVRDNVICIGSDYVKDLVKINKETGHIYDTQFVGGHAFLRKYYPKILEISQEELLKIIRSEDVFTKNIKVYDVSNSDIEPVEDYCEEVGYPHCTHSGKIMYENTFFLKKEDAFKRLIEENNAKIKYLNSRIDENYKKLQENIKDLEKSFEFLEKIKKV